MSWQPTELERKLLAHVIDRNGSRRQEMKAVEEYAEAAAAIARFTNRTHGHGDRLEDVAEELADTEIMHAQLHMIHPEIEAVISTIRARKLAVMAVRFNFPETI